MLTQKPLLARDLDFSLFLGLVLIHSMPSVELFLPRQKVLDSHWRKGCELRSLIDCLLLDNDGLLLKHRSTFDEVLVDPVPGFLYDIEDDGLMGVVEQDLFYFFVDVADVVTSNAGNRFQFVA